MSLDPYSLCPCGSGNKLKFCCHAITGEMAKVERLIRGNQNRQALQTLETLSEQHPGNPWVGINRAAIMMGESHSSEAVEILEPVVEQFPDHLHAIALLANAAFSADGFELGKPFIHRAFQRCEVAFPEMIGNLALGIAASMYSQQKYMAARQHLTLSMRLVSDEDKQNVFVRLLEFDGNRRLPFPLRSVHELAAIDGADDLTAEAAKARRLSDTGCWRPAAKIFANLAEQNPDSAGLWQNVALCRAWDGDERHAATAFHKAAELTAEYEDAVELETLAQLLDYNTTDDVTTFSSREFRVESIVKLLPMLDAHKQIVRMDVTQEAEDGSPVAMYHVLDRDESTEVPDGSIALESIAGVIAQVEVYDADPDDPETNSAAFLTGEEGEPLDAACRCFLDCGGDLVSADDDDDDEDPFKETMPRELSILSWRWHLPDKTPVIVQRELEQRKWKLAAHEEWPETPLTCLGGKSPKNAAGDADRRTALDAGVVVLDSYCDRAKYNLEIETLRKRLSLEPPREIDVTPETTFNSFTVMQLQRLPVETLSDEQLSSTLNRAILIHHGRFLKRALVEALKRPTCTERIDVNRVHMTLFDLCIEQGDRGEAFDWSRLGAAEAQTQDKSFEKSLQWTIRELSLRVEDPGDDEIGPLLDRLETFYLPKVPDLKPAIEELLSMHNITPPWEGRSEPAIAGPASEGGIWTPSSAEKSAEPAKKIWIPGQD